MVDDRSLNGLSSTFIGLYPSQNEARALAEKAGMRTGNIDLGGPPRVFWWNVVKEANNTNAVVRLIDAALEDYPDHPNLVDARDDHYDRLTAPVASQPLLDANWQPKLSVMRAEKIMGSTSTFLPISFLEVGTQCSRSVARVLRPDRGTGSGFIIDGNLFVTNHHVVPDEATARETRIQFNFQEKSSGLPENVSEFRLDPDTAWATSPTAEEQGHDFTIVGVVGDANETWGALPLSSNGIQVGDRVMIVQHPEGGFKKVALHNNLVTRADDDVLQYYTDTLPGSSGSPVFDNTWRVVGVHRAGGNLEAAGGRTVFRNEGTNIGRVAEAIDGLAAP